MEKEENDHIIKNKFHIVDLGGSERASLHGEKGIILS